MSNYLYVFPPNFQLDPTTGENNDNIDAIGYCMDYLYTETSVLTETHIPIFDEALKIIFDGLESAYDDTDTEQAAKHESILDSLAAQYEIAGWNYASENILNSTAYSTTTVLNIKKNIWRERVKLHQKIGFKYPVVRILEIYGFTNIVISKPVAPVPKWDGTYIWDGTISWDGDYTGSEYLFDVDATKPAALSNAQAQYIGEELCKSYIPSYIKLYDFTLV